MTVTSDVSHEISLSSLNPGSVLDVQTKNRHYRIEYLQGDEVRISGHPVICPTPTAAQVLGSTSQGTGMEEGVVARGKHLVFQRLDEDRPITTSEITDIHVSGQRRPNSN